MKIRVTEDDGDVVTLAVIDMTAEAALKSHGYDPNLADYTVDDPQGDLEDAISNASNLQELKDALTDNNRPVQARGGR